MMLPATLSDDAPHLLVVDDDRRIRDLLSRFLSGEGYRVTTAETAADARAKLNGLSFDLLILDVMMPGENGFDFAKSLRGTSSVPILMLTARDAAESRIKGLEMGADDYLSKPFEPRELSLRIANILKRAQPAAAPPVESVALRAVRLSSGARRIAQRRGGHPADRPRARDAAHPDGDAGRDRDAAGARRQWRHGLGTRRGRAGQPAAPQDRAAIPPIRCSCRPCAASATGWWPAHDQHRHRDPHYPHGLRAARRSVALVRFDSADPAHSRRSRAHPRRAGGG